MSRPGPPLFLAKAGYRRRRLHDAARLVPVFGIFLIFLPILWASGDAGPDDTALDGIYLFVVWVGLIASAAALAPGLRRTTGADPVDPLAGGPD